MGKRVIWLQRGRDSFNEIFNYQRQEFSPQTARNLWNKVSKKIATLSENPEIGRPVQKKKSSFCFSGQK